MLKKQLIFFITLLVFGVGLVRVVVAAEVGVSIDNGKTNTYNRRVLLYINIAEDKDVEEMRISEKSNYSGAEWIPFSRRKYWLLSSGAENKTVYVQFRNAKQEVIANYRDSIILANEPLSGSAVLNSGNAITYSLHIPITLTYSNGVEAIALHDTKDGLEEKDFVPPQTHVQWILPEGEGQKKVFITFRDNGGKKLTLEKKITYRPAKDTLEAGTLLGGSKGTVYYYGHDDRLHLFPSLLVFHSYHPDLSKVKKMSDEELRRYQVGLPVCLRGGTWLVQFKGESKVYATLPGCQLQPLRSPTEAFVFYGKDWGKRIVRLPVEQKRHYEIISFSAEEDDRDRDGVSAKQEERYGISDTREDTDGDGVSDYEEIYFWKTDPARRDTDRDSVSDGREIQSFRSPTGKDEITSVPTNTYVFPAGSIVHLTWYDLRYYYTLGDNQFTFFARSKTHDNFPNYGISPDFVLEPPLGVYSHITDYADAKEVDILSDPHVKFYSHYQPL